MVYILRSTLDFKSLNTNQVCGQPINQITAAFPRTVLVKHYHKQSSFRSAILRRIIKKKKAKNVWKILLSAFKSFSREKLGNKFIKKTILEV